MPYDYERLGRRIAERRKHFFKISQRQMAEELGMYQADISNIEHAKSGSGITDLSKLEFIADYLDIPLESLLFGTDINNHIKPYTNENIIGFTSNEKMPEKHFKLLKKLFSDTLAKNGVQWFQCGEYQIYMITEQLTDFNAKYKRLFENSNEMEKVVSKPHLYVVFNDEVIAIMTFDTLSLSDIIYEENLKNLKIFIQPDVVDINNILNTINPFYYLKKYCTDANECSKYHEQFLERQHLLESFKELPLLIIESVYVLEDCRKLGICRMLFNLLIGLYGDYTAWMNLEPTAGEALFSEQRYFPFYSTSEVGQLHQNAAIAEKLGYRISSEGLQREIETVDNMGQKEIQVAEIRKYAYKLSQPLNIILKNDTNILDSSIARKRASISSEDKNSSNIIDCYSDVINGEYIMELRQQTAGKIVYIFGIRKSDGRFPVAVSKESAIRNTMNVETIEHYEDISDSLNSSYFNLFHTIYFLSQGVET